MKSSAFPDIILLFDDENSDCIEKEMAEKLYLGCVIPPPAGSGRGGEFTQPRTFFLTISVRHKMSDWQGRGFFVSLSDPWRARSGFVVTGGGTPFENGWPSFVAAFSHLPPKMSLKAAGRKLSRTNLHCFYSRLSRNTGKPCCKETQ